MTVGTTQAVGTTQPRIQVSPVSVERKGITQEHLSKLISQFNEKFDPNEEEKACLVKIADIVVTVEEVSSTPFTSAAYKQAMIIMKAILEGQEEAAPTAQRALTAETSLPSQLLADLLQIHINKDFSGLGGNKDELKTMAKGFFITVLTLPLLITDESDNTESKERPCQNWGCHSKNCNADTKLRDKLMEKLGELYPEEALDQIKESYDKGLNCILENGHGQTDKTPAPPEPHPERRSARVKKKPQAQAQQTQAQPQTQQPQAQPQTQQPQAQPQTQQPQAQSQAQAPTQTQTQQPEEPVGTPEERDSWGAAICNTINEILSYIAGLLSNLTESRQQEVPT